MNESLFADATLNAARHRNALYTRVFIPDCGIDAGGWRLHPAMYAIYQRETLSTTLCYIW